MYFIITITFNAYNMNDNNIFFFKSYVARLNVSYRHSFTYAIFCEFFHLQHTQFGLVRLAQDVNYVAYLILCNVATCIYHAIHASIYVRLRVSWAGGASWPHIIFRHANEILITFFTQSVNHIALFSNISTDIIRIAYIIDHL